MPHFPRDGVPDNTHPVNLVEMPEGSPMPVAERPPLFEVYMRMAEELAKRSTCARLQVGTVITDARLENVVAIGYNGNARGFPNRCDGTEPGRCGCIHSEQNALVKAPGTLPDKVAFVTASPCVMCAKLLVQAGISHLYYRTAYRSAEGIEVLKRGGIVPVEYTRWATHWREVRS
ncbi:deoxycytidylate deaminase [Gaopeijia maritima]|uniref:Deaminase n=1 Tax=Gaopeijia maritima TaxID=3119007 RepID=A0ABU9E9K7_9BACT